MKSHLRPTPLHKQQISQQKYYKTRGHGIMYLKSLKKITANQEYCTQQGHSLEPKENNDLPKK
jgi:hypothetical protein